MRQDTTHRIDQDTAQNVGHAVGARLDGPDLDGTDSWSDAGHCAGADPDLFFPERGQDAAAAKAFCRGCPVRTRCLDWALETGQRYGVWGGMTEGQRRRLRRTEPDRPVAVRHLQLVR